MQKTILVLEEPRGPSQLVEVPVSTAGVSRVNLPDVQQLRSDQVTGVVIKAIRLVTDKVLTNAPISGFQTAPRSELVKASLVLYSQGWEKGYAIPLLTLNDQADADATTATTIPYRSRTTRFDNWQNVDWSKSYLLYANGQPTALPGGNPYTVLLEVEYERYTRDGLPLQGPA